MRLALALALVAAVGASAQAPARPRGRVVDVVFLPDDAQAPAVVVTIANVGAERAGVDHRRANPADGCG